MTDFTANNFGEHSLQLSSDQLWSMAVTYMSYMSAHNEASRKEKIIQAIEVNKMPLCEGLKPMFEFMVVHGMPDNFTPDRLPFSQAGQERNAKPECLIPMSTGGNEVLINQIVFWVEGVFQTQIGILGIVGNITAMLLFMKGGRSYDTIFYKLLTCLLSTQTAYIFINQINFFCRKIENFYFDMAFVYFLYPMPALLLQASIFLTVLLSWHRYRSTCAPVDYFVTWRNKETTGPALKWLAAFLLVSFLMISPLYLEPKMNEKSQIFCEEINSTYFILTNKTEFTIETTDIRTNPHYVVWYRNFFLLTFTFVIPFIFLVCILPTKWH